MKKRFFSHPLAVVETGAVGEGTRIWAFAHVMKGARIGSHSSVGDHCFIESGVRIGDGVTVKNGVALWEGVEIGDGVFIGPQATFTNDRHPRSPRSASAASRYASKDWLEKTRVETGATIGANATILCGIRIGAFAFVGAGSVVSTDVPDYALWLGVPGRLRGHVCECGARLRFTKERATCPSCRRRYTRHRDGVERRE